MSGSNLSCQHCGFSQLCLPFTLNNAELDTLDDIIERKKPLHKGDFLIEAVLTCTLCMRYAVGLLRLLP